MANLDPQAVQQAMEAITSAAQATWAAAIDVQQAMMQNMMANGDLGRMLWRGAGVLGVIAIILLVLIIIPICKMFAKMGNKWYEALIPGHNCYVMITNAGKPGWWIFVGLLFLIPVLGWIVGLILIIVMHFAVSIGLAKKFGKGTRFGVGLALLPIIFYPILGYGNATYSR